VTFRGKYNSDAAEFVGGIEIGGSISSGAALVQHRKPSKNSAKTRNLRLNNIMSD